MTNQHLQPTKTSMIHLPICLLTQNLLGQRSPKESDKNGPETALTTSATQPTDKIPANKQKQQQ